jgi:L-alanine-DL-glutamate epimerase-like enolase superfamily enzyme
VKYDVCFCGNLTFNLPVPTLKVRAGVEMALIDAVANSIRVPLWRLFGGASNTIITDITVKILYNL